MVGGDPLTPGYGTPGYVCSRYAAPPTPDVPPRGGAAPLRPSAAAHLRAAVPGAGEGLPGGRRAVRGGADRAGPGGGRRRRPVRRGDRGPHHADRRTARRTVARRRGRNRTVPGDRVAARGALPPGDGRGARGRPDRRRRRRPGGGRRAAHGRRAPAAPGAGPAGGAGIPGAVGCPHPRRRPGHRGLRSGAALPARPDGLPEGPRSSEHRRPVDAPRDDAGRCPRTPQPEDRRGLSYSPSWAATAAAVGSTEMPRSTVEIARSGSFRPWPVKVQTTVSPFLTRPPSTARRSPATEAADAGSQNTPSRSANIR